jgi:hypothetical protein
MLRVRSFSRIVLTTVAWMIAWGVIAAAITAVVTVIQPDTGHIPRQKVPLMIGIPSAVFGGIAGFIFACVLEANGVPKLLGARSRLVLGALFGASAGILSMNFLSDSIFAVLFSALLGAILLGSFVQFSNTLRKKC